MRKYLFALAFALTFVTGTNAASAGGAIRCGKLLDVRSGRLLENQLISFDATGTITSVAPAGSALPEGTIDLMRATRLPGLMDVHTHITAEPTENGYAGLGVSTPLSAIHGAKNARLTLLASHIHDNPGSALTIRGGASPRVNHNVFSRNGLSERVGSALVVERDTQPAFFGNVFQGIAADAFRILGDAAAARIARDNWFADGHESQGRPSNVPSGRRGR